MMKFHILLLLFAFIGIERSYGQANNNISTELGYADYTNNLDIQLLGNKGFFSIGYNRIIFQKNKYWWLIGPAIGYVPGSHEDSSATFPSFYHLNIGTSLVYGQRLFRPTIGVNYTKILLSGDPSNLRPKSNYNRILGDLGILICLRNAPVSFKLVYTPMFFDDNADDVEDFPIGIVIRVAL